MNAVARGGSHGAAFFDVDGTLLESPSLERQFFAGLRSRRTIPVRSYFLWLAEAVRLMPHGFECMRHANKMYLRGVSIHDCKEEQGEQPELAVPRFFPGAIERVAWHARQGHAIVLVSGTLAPLAAEVGLALTLRLAVRGVAAILAVCATRLEENEGRWTGRIAGDAMFGEGKGRAVRRMIRENKFDAQQCFAYGDSWSDRSMLEAVGRPVAVNPARRLARIARRKKWPVLVWAEERNPTGSSRSGPSESRKTEQTWENVG